MAPISVYFHTHTLNCFLMSFKQDKVIIDGCNNELHGMKLLFKAMAIK